MTTGKKNQTDDAMDTYFIHRLNEELPKLEAENVITSETSNAIRSYYQKQEEIYNNQTRQKNLAESKEKREKLPFILSVISSILIFVGIVSLIAYNWAAMGREIKTILALFVAFASPAAYLILNVISKRKNITPAPWVKGFLTLSWALLFGAALAYITQIYKLPMQETTFLILWLVSSILITFAMDSSLIYFCSLILLAVYCIDAQEIINSSAWFYYPSVVALYYYARKAPVKRTILIFEAIFLLGFVLEKMLPGLWILCYSGVAALLFLKADRAEEKTKKGWTVLSWIFFFVYLIVLSDGLWNDIGFKYFRTQLYYNRFAALYDYAATILLFAGPLWLCFKTKKKNYFAATFLVITAICYLLCSFNDNAWRYIPTVMLYVAFASYTFLLIKYDNPYTLLAIPAFWVIFFMADTNYPILHILNLIILTLLIFYYKNKLQKSVPVFVSAGALLLIFENWYLNSNNYAFLMDCVHDKLFYFDFVLFLLIPAASIVYCIIQMVKHRKTPLLFILFITVGQFLLLKSYKNFRIAPWSMMFDILFVLPGIYALINLYKNKDKLSFIYLAISVLNYISIFLYTKATPGLCIYLYVFLILSAINSYSFATVKPVPEIITGINWICTAGMLVPLHAHNLFDLDKAFPQSQAGIFIFCVLYLFIVLLVIPVIVSIKNKQYKALFFSAYSLMLLISIILGFCGINAAIIFEYTSLTFMIAYGILGIFIAVKTKSIADINFFMIFVCYILIVKFFQFDTGLVERGIVFILCGIAILIVNKLISKKEAKNENEAQL